MLITVDWCRWQKWMEAAN